MTKFNKTLLAAAVAAAVALPGIASAASLGYESGKQITFAKDLIVNDGTTINTPSELTLRATSDDATRIATVAGDAVTVKVTLTNGARFDSTADASSFVSNFAVGAQLGGAPGATLAGRLVGTPYYSANGQELNFTFTAPGNGTVGTAPDFALRLNSMQVTSLVQGLFTGNFIGAEITAQNAAGQQILAAGTTIARSVWGLNITSEESTNLASRIDVAGGSNYGRKTRFSPTGTVGGAEGVANTLWSPGSIIIDVTETQTTGNAGLAYVNNFSAVAAQPEYNVVATAVMSITVNGSNLNAFRNNNAFLNSASTCDAAGSLNGTVNAAGDTIAFTAPASNALFSSVTNAPPGPSTVYVCLRANGANEMMAQALTATVNVDYQLSTQRRNPPATTVNLSPLEINGNTLVFQNVNPGANSRAQSFLRITNNTADVCPITIDAKDDAGRLSGEVTFNLPAHASQHFNSDELENGSPKGTGSFGDGTGRWYVRVTAECNAIKASALNRNTDTGVVTNLTPEKGLGTEWLTPSTRL
ncbi:hypothetical protein [Luteimonas deserti]|uniref:Uncharacterized protein n=1 Tax=Luteimonas deserti TaxID=2752306 RepID=A0A7Z0QRM0_9GAMM|nr:hypothetical protein [Luteimonas deserti]NYZ62253.1 hypothetical protein [Luteimonas deserti]